MEDIIDVLGPLDIQESIIKVMGVGGGGCNAINYLYKQGIQDVTLLVCNTDKMSLAGSSVPGKLQLGTGLGVGGDLLWQNNMQKRIVSVSKKP